MKNLAMKKEMREGVSEQMRKTHHGHELNTENLELENASRDLSDFVGAAPRQVPSIAYYILHERNFRFFNEVFSIQTSLYTATLISYYNVSN